MLGGKGNERESRKKTRKVSPKKFAVRGKGETGGVLTRERRSKGGGISGEKDWPKKSWDGSNKGGGGCCTKRR